MVRSTYADPHPDPDTYRYPTSNPYPAAYRNSGFYASSGIDPSSLICFSSQSRPFIR